MKKRNLWIVVLFLAPVFCLAQNDNVLSSGQLVTNTLAKKWINNFHTLHKGDIQGFTYGKEMLQEILSDKSAAGLKISYGLDEAQNLKIVLNAVDTFSTDSEEPPYDDGLPCPDHCPDGIAGLDKGKIVNVAEIGSQIDKETAKEWMARFNEVHPNNIKFYVFGKTLVEQVLNQPQGAGMYIARGMDEKGKERMTLFGVDKAGKLLHRIVGADSEENLVTFNFVN